MCRFRFRFACRLLRFGVALGITGGVAVAAAPLAPLVLTNVSQVRQLSSMEAGRAIPVKLKGVLLAEADPRQRAVIIADETGGLYALASRNLFSPFRRGDWLEIDGVSNPGEFAPIVQVAAARKIGTAPIPAPQAVSYWQLLNGSLDAQWIEISGVVRQIIPPPAGARVWRLVVAADGGVVAARGVFTPDPALQVDAEVRFQAVCLYQFNRKRQVLTPVLSIPEGIKVRVDRPAPAQPFDLPVRAADSLLRFSADAPSGHRVHVRGIVTQAQPGAQLWIRDQSAGLRIQTRQTDELRPGDEIDVLGFPSYGNYTPLLEDAIFRKIGAHAPPEPLRVTNVAAAFEYEDNLIQTDARLKEVQRVLDGFAFTFDLNGSLFRAMMAGTAAAETAAGRWLPGSLVRVTGICSLVHDDARPMMGIWQPQAFQLLLRAPADLEILVAPPWWTPQRVSYALGMLCAGLLLVSGLGLALSRRRLREQAHRREMAEAEFAAILSERNRVAREIHDTLAQGLAATSVQLRLAKKQAGADAAALTHHLDTAQQLVRDSLEEARSSIWNPRSQVLETGDLPAALNGILKQMADGSELQTALKVSGRPRRLAPVLENNLLRVGQEAITNAVRHSRARRLTVTLDFAERHFRLTVQDDGRGFDPARPPASPGGFGLVGMRERAAELKADLQIRSQSTGTEIALVVPLSGE